MSGGVRGGAFRLPLLDPVGISALANSRFVVVFDGNTSSFKAYSGAVKMYQAAELALWKSAPL